MEIAAIIWLVLVVFYLAYRSDKLLHRIERLEREAPKNNKIEV